MRITQEADYALRIVCTLAEHEKKDAVAKNEKNKRLDAGVISDITIIPPRFTLKILRKLVIGGLVKSYKGKNGGYALAKASEEITMKDVIELIDGRIALSRCIENGHECSKEGFDKSGCRIHGIFVAINAELSKKLDMIKISDAINPEISLSALFEILK